LTDPAPGHRAIASKASTIVYQPFGQHEEQRMLSISAA